MGNPFAGCTFSSRRETQDAARAMFEPLVPAFHEGGSRVRLGNGGADFPQVAEDLEGFARPLWAVAPLGAGGGTFEHWELFRRGLAEGTDPDAPGYWGDVDDRDQRLVEMAAVGFALALVPEHLYEPLDDATKTRIAVWLGQSYERAPHANNWQFFRVLVDLGLQRIGAASHPEQVEASLVELERHHLGDGWYADGELPGNVDHYIAWAYHCYGLIYAELVGERDPERTRRFRDRASDFANHWQHWFDPAGRVVPYGRSLTYRFAAASFWGALAFADDDAGLGWDVVRGLWQRHLQWWATQDVADASGVLSIGWTYPNLFLSEGYNSPGSPYWAAKAFLPLALPEQHPFWRAEPAPLPPLAGATAARPAAFVASHDATQAQVLVGGRGFWFMRQGAAKYGRFAYSSALGFALDGDDPFLREAADSALLLRDDRGDVRGRSSVEAADVDGDVVLSRWRPWPDVVVWTALVGACPWHVRVHVVDSPRSLVVYETGFTVGWRGGDPSEVVERHEADGEARVHTDFGVSALRALHVDDDGASLVDAAARSGSVVPLAPNTALMWPRALVPRLRATIEAGTTLLGCVAAGSEDVDALVVLDHEAVQAALERAAAALQQWRAAAGEASADAG